MLEYKYVRVPICLSKNMLQNFFKPMQGSQGEKVSKKHPDNKNMS